MLHTSDIDTYIDTAYTILRLIVYVIAAFVLLRTLFNVRIAAFVADMHDENATKASWMRGMGTIIIVSAVVLAAYQIYKTGSTQEWLIIGMLSVGIGGKAWQKHTESKSSNNTTNTKI